MLKKRLENLFVPNSHTWVTLPLIISLEFDSPKDFWLIRPAPGKLDFCLRVFVRIGDSISLLWLIPVNWVPATFKKVSRLIFPIHFDFTPISLPQVLVNMQRHCAGIATLPVGSSVEFFSLDS